MTIYLSHLYHYLNIYHIFNIFGQKKTVSFETVSVFVFCRIFCSLEFKLYQGLQEVRRKLLLALRVGLEPTTYRLTAERSTNWANGEYILATTYFLSRVTHKYRRHIGAWLLCSEWEQVFPPCNHHQKIYFNTNYIVST